jgi:hypothetical protein
MCDRPENIKRLRVIKTARTVEEINSADHSGLTPRVKPLKRNPEIYNRVAVYQHKITKKIEVIGDHRTFMGEEYECVIPFTYFYHYSFPSPFAA